MANVSVRHGILIRRPPSDVFGFISDPDNMPQWQSTLYDVKEKRNARDGGKLQRATRVHDKRNVLGKDIDAEYEVVDFEPDRRVTMEVVDGPVSFRMQWDLEAVDGGTYFTASGGGDLGDLRMSDRAAARSAQHLLEQDLETLRELLEENA